MGFTNWCGWLIRDITVGFNKISCHVMCRYFFLQFKPLVKLTFSKKKSCLRYFILLILIKFIQKLNSATILIWFEFQKLH